MATIDIILRDSVINLGKAGDIVKVKNGYGRNYLIPKGFAIAATKKNKARLEHDKQVISIRNAKLARTAEELKTRLEGLTISITKKVGDNEKLFGSVTPKDIVSAINAQGFSLEKKKVHMADAIKSVGVHEVSIKLAYEVVAAVKVWVVSE
jgi:large subunit ribosomal protein L9